MRRSCQLVGPRHEDRVGPELSLPAARVLSGSIEAALDREVIVLFGKSRSDDRLRNHQPLAHAVQPRQHHGMAGAVPGLRQAFQFPAGAVRLS